MIFSDPALRECRRSLHAVAGDHAVDARHFGFALLVVQHFAFAFVIGAKDAAARLEVGLGATGAGAVVGAELRDLLFVGLALGRGFRFGLALARNQVLVTA